MGENLRKLEELTAQLTEPSQEGLHAALDALRGAEEELSFRMEIVQVFLDVPDAEMYGEVLKIVLRTTGSELGVFGYIDEEDNFICPSMTRGVWEKCLMSDKTIVFPREAWGGIWGRALVGKRSLYENEDFVVPDGHIPITRALMTPILHREVLIGLFEVANKPTDYGEKDQKLLETIAEYVAPILHARLQRDGIRS